MNKIILKAILNAVGIVVLVLLAIFIYKTFIDQNDSGGGRVDSSPPILEAVKHVNKQVFIEHYNAVDMTYSEVPQDWLSFLSNIGIQQEVVVLLRGRIPAGFDLEEFSEKDIWVSADGKRAQITLPAPKIFAENVSIDFEHSRILSQSDTCPNFLCEDTLVAYQGQVMPAGRDRLIEFARQNGILEQAAKDGKEYYEQLLKSLGFEEVRVVVTGYGL